MPEGDTIFRTAASLRRWIGGREITAARGAPGGLDASPLVGTTLDEVEARGKHLLMRFSGGLTLHTHMRMTGSWHVYPSGERWRKPARQARLVLESGHRQAVCFDAPVIELLTRAAERVHPSLRRLGPDVLGPTSIDADHVRRRAEARSVASPTVGELLLDQQVVSGIGNIYRCESLFLCGVHPGLPSADLAPDVLERLVATASRLMQGNVDDSMARRTFDGGAGRAWVYRRAGRECRRCGTVIRRDLLGQQARAVYWCPTCQASSGSTPRLPSPPGGR